MLTHRVPAARNAIRILRYLAAEGAPVRLNVIARDLDLHASNCLSLLRTLVDEGMVDHDPTGKIYSAGMGVVSLAQQVLTWRDSPQVTQPLLDAFSRKHAMTVMLWRRATDTEIVLVARSVQGVSVHVSAQVGTRLPLLTGSIGHVIAGAGLVDESSVHRHFEANCKGRGDEIGHFLAEAKQAGEQGWKLTSGEGWHGLSVLLPVGSGVPIQVVTAVMLSPTYPPEIIDDLARDLKKLAGALAGEELQGSALPFHHSNPTSTIAGERMTTEPWPTGPIDAANADEKREDAS